MISLLFLSCAVYLFVLGYRLNNKLIRVNRALPYAPNRNGVFYMEFYASSFSLIKYLDKQYLTLTKEVRKRITPNQYSFLNETTSDKITEYAAKANHNYGLTYFINNNVLDAIQDKYGKVQSVTNSKIDKVEYVNIVHGVECDEDTQFTVIAEYAGYNYLHPIDIFVFKGDLNDLIDNFNYKIHICNNLGSTVAAFSLFLTALEMSLLS